MSSRDRTQLTPHILLVWRQKEKNEASEMAREASSERLEEDASVTGDKGQQRPCR